jgi:hypothetical protein
VTDGAAASFPSHAESQSAPAFTEKSGTDSEGRYRAHGKISAAVVGTYIFVLLVIVLLFSRDVGTTFWWVPWVLGLLLVVMLARYLSTTYRIDEAELEAWRIMGSRRVRLDEVRRIEYTSLRDLAPSGSFFGGWGWRGRMWSPRIGSFDAIHTDASLGILVTAGEEPLYISPANPEGFARELSRRVRSYSGRLAVDVGDPAGNSPASSGF